MIVVTGASGQLGRLVIEGLLDRLDPAEVVAAARTPAKADGLAARGVRVRRADYSEPSTLAEAFAGADKLLLVSSSEVGRRLPQHLAVVAAAKAAGVGLLAYTSVLKADTSGLPVAAEHKATEEAIRASGLPFVLLRNGWYLENHTARLGPALERGEIVGAAGQGRFASAARADYAAAAVAVLTGQSHESSVYELAGDASFTLADLAAEVSRQAGRPVRYTDLAPERYREVLLAAGVPALYADLMAGSDLGASRGELDSPSRDLRRLIGRPTTPLAEAVAAGLKGL